MFFREATGANREPELAEGDYADVAAAPGRRATWESLNLIHLCLILPFKSLNFPQSILTLRSR